MQRRHELTEAQWEAIQDRIPGKNGDPGRTGEDNRLFVNAVLYVARTGIPWRDLPARFGNWNSVWRRFDRWSAAGVWTALAEGLGEPDLEELQLDSTSVKVQQSAVGARRPASEKKTRPTSGVVWDVREAD
jgi:transposase